MKHIEKKIKKRKLREKGSRGQKRKEKKRMRKEDEGEENEKEKKISLSLLRPPITPILARTFSSPSSPFPLFILGFCSPLYPFFKYSYYSSLPLGSLLLFLNPFARNFAFVLEWCLFLMSILGFFCFLLFSYLSLFLPFSSNSLALVNSCTFLHIFPLMSEFNVHFV